jgi:hypothetical protein
VFRYLCFKRIVLCVQVYGCFYILTIQRTISRVQWWLLRGLPDSGNCDVTKHAKHLLISGEHISLANIIFVPWKLMCVSYVFFHTEFKYVIRIALSPRFCMTEFLKCNFSEFHYFLCYQYIINMAEAHYYILNIVWACKLNHNKDSRHVCPITDSQTVGTWN